MTNQTGNLSSCGVGMEPEGRNERKDCIDCGCFEPCAPQAGEPSPAQGDEDLIALKARMAQWDEDQRRVVAHGGPAKTEQAMLRAMVSNYANGHSWDHLDSETVTRAADEIKALRAALAAIPAPAQPDAGEEHGSFSQEAKIPTEQASLVSTLVDALKEARAALHYHYLEWDGEPEDAIPLQQARAECDRALAKATGAA